jgi:drug/metabolite transporter (DMT)-like permease
VLVGRVAFSERMDALGLIGCGVIIAAGIASAQLERRQRQTFAALCLDGSVAPSIGNG